MDGSGFKLRQGGDGVGVEIRVGKPKIFEGKPEAAAVGFLPWPNRSHLSPWFCHQSNDI